MNCQDHPLPSYFNQTFGLPLCGKESCGHDAEHFPAPAAQLQNKSDRGESSQDSGVGLGPAWGELSPHHSLKVPVPLTHPWDNIQQHLGQGMSLGCTTQKQRWGGDVLVMSSMPVSRFHKGRCAVESVPAIPALIPDITMQHQAVSVHHQCPLQGMLARLLTAN